MNHVNFIPRARRRAQAAQRRMRRWGWACSAYAAVVCAAIVVVAGPLGPHDRRDLGEQTAVHQKIGDVGHEVAQLRERLDRDLTAIQDREAIDGQPDWSLLLGLLADLREGEVVLTSCSLFAEPLADPEGERPTSRRHRLRLEGVGKNQDAVTQFVVRMEGVPVFDEVNFVQWRRETYLGAERTAFTVTCVAAVEEAG
jgi:hypothetical protein